MALDTAAIVRGASGALFVLLGVACAILAYRSKEDRGLAIGVALHGTGFGGAFINLNLDLQNEAAYAWASGFFGIVAWGASALGLLLVIRAVAPRATLDRTLAAGALVIYAGSSVGAFLVNPAPALENFGAIPEARGLFIAAQAEQRLVGALLATTALAIALRIVHEPARRTPLALLAVGLVLWPAFAQASTFLNAPATPMGWVPRLGTSAVLLGTIVAWLVASERGAGRGALAVVLAIPSAMLAAVASTAFLAADVQEYRNGVVRTIAVAAIALAVFRFDLLKARLPLRQASRASTATVGLAGFFIVAQIAQNYLSTTYGLLMGGVVAGALLFAAAPLQRALEGSPTRRVPVRDAQMEDAYRFAVRAAIADGKMTREEELHLSEVATRLGLSPADTARLRHEVEDEIGGAT